MKVSKENLAVMCRLVNDQVQQIKEHLLISEEFISTFEKNVGDELKGDINAAAALVQALRRFKGKDVMLLIEWLYQAQQQDAITLQTVSIKNEADFEQLKALPDGQVSLDIDLQNDLKDLDALYELIKAQKKIHHIMLRNVDPIQHKTFIERLYVLELLQIDAPCVTHAGP